uniref:Cdx protein n=1 Tax=Steromphala varia TaxID=2072698 RepID=D9IDZ3_9VEST|nr:Cdx protein [Steromphala varia]
MAVWQGNSSLFLSRPSPTSLAFNFPPFGYPTQASGYGQEYSQYGTVPETSYQQPPWAGMYGTAPRSSHGGLDEWNQGGYMVPATSYTQQAYRLSRYFKPPESDSMGLDYSQNGIGHGHSPFNGSPPLTSSSGDESPNGSGSRISYALGAPNEWMKPAQTYPVTGKTRTKDKYRVAYSDHQRLELEKEFRYSRYITIRRKAEIAAQLQLSERQVKIWFQNRRAKERKQNKKGKDGDSDMPGKLDYDEEMSPSHSMSLPFVNMISPELHSHAHHSFHLQSQHQQPPSQSPSPVLSPPTSMPQLMVKSELSAIDLGAGISHSLSNQRLV